MYAALNIFEAKHRQSDSNKDRNYFLVGLNMKYITSNDTILGPKSTVTAPKLYIFM